MQNISQFTEQQIAIAKSHADDRNPCDDRVDPKVEALVNDLIDRVADKWTMLILEVLVENGVLRYISF